MNKYIRLQDSFLEWEWFDKPEMVQLFLYFLLSANKEPKQWQGITIEPGQFVTSRNIINKKTGLSERTIRTCIDRLKATNEIASKTTSKYTVITICKYGDYANLFNESDQQSDQLNDQQPTNRTTLKTISNIVAKSSTKRFVKPSATDIKDFITANSYPVDAERFYNYYEANGWKVGKNPMKDWRAAVRTWARKSTQNKTADVGVILRDNNPDKYNEEHW